MRFPASSCESVASSAALKFATRSSVARQSAMMLKWSIYQRRDNCSWLKAPTAIIMPPKVSAPLK